MVLRFRCNSRTNHEVNVANIPTEKVNGNNSKELRNKALRTSSSFAHWSITYIAHMSFEWNFSLFKAMAEVVA